MKYTKTTLSIALGLTFGLVALTSGCGSKKAEATNSTEDQQTVTTGSNTMITLGHSASAQKEQNEVKPTTEPKTNTPTPTTTQATGVVELRSNK